MNMRYRIPLASCIFMVLALSFINNVNAFGYNFVFPSARRSAVSGYMYADPDNPGHLALDYRFSMHTLVTSAQKGWIFSLLQAINHAKGGTKLSRNSSCLGVY